jgi:hypothetical protein
MGMILGPLAAYSIGMIAEQAIYAWGFHPWWTLAIGYVLARGFTMYLHYTDPQGRADFLYQMREGH